MREDQTEMNSDIIDPIPGKIKNISKYGLIVKNISISNNSV